MTAEVLSQPNGVVANGGLNPVSNNATAARIRRRANDVGAGESRRRTTKPLRRRRPAPATKATMVMPRRANFLNRLLRKLKLSMFQRKRL
ncbi:hypothetical protein Pyn_13052 [Prunus yedoensis var. nudiflora]|uniref:Uncharacterized protein n=1 Tax=Prunus yedoensis var. nudiflora TaxID=2094558 RepID=A0A314YTS7_PRUYE|nr:hypothetical protein Pyn_13052 [Prunus yedoensis var. nudiflora]